ncbi:MAG TPA: redoxin domain-containing protein [Deltaproteobacteria bacterium]|nr:redoxin domain-containing protein [Deltaproteobacteria bacterium]HOI06430.1 redoxin domain-containing protein [Deltaproteobacteria bacterium]
MKRGLYDSGELKPIDSELMVRVGEQAPDFSLKAVSGKMVTLSEYRDKSNVVIFFIPESWTSLSSEQLFQYNAAQETFRMGNTVILAISVESLPALFSWTSQMGALWFPVLSDFWPHGAVAKKYGVLRSDGIAERAAFIVDKKGRIRYIGLQNINSKPSFDEIVKELDKLK